MTQYSRVWTVYRKELVETLRDRRTLIAMVFVPIVLYPVLMLVLVQALSSEKGRQEQRQYHVVVPNQEHKQWLAGILKREDEEEARRQELLKETQGTKAAQQEATRDQMRTRLGSEQIHIDVAEDESKLWELVESGRYHAAILSREVPVQGRGAEENNRVVQILYSDTDPLSDVVFRQLNRILANEAERIIRHRVTTLAGSEDVLMPIVATNLSTTSPDRQFAKALAMIVPFLLVTMTVTGAMYPAIDLTAGERERGTLETLAVSPVPTGQIVAGKFGVIVTIAMATTALNLASMTAVIHYGGIGDMLAAASPTGDIESVEAEEQILEKPVTPGTIEAQQRINLHMRRELEATNVGKTTFVSTAAPIVLLAMIPFAVLFGGVMLAVCSFARTFKEAQNYMMPVMMSAILPAMVVSYMPTIELEGVLTVIPVANIVLLMRELFLGNFETATVAICLLSTCFYAVAAVVAATRIYGNESVLFSDVGSYKTLLQRKFIRPEVAPTASFAIFVLAVLFPFNFYMQSSLADPSGAWQGLAKGVIATQLILFAAVPIFLAWYTKLDLVNTFSIRMPSIMHIVAAIMMAASVVPFAHAIRDNLYAAFPPGEGAMHQLEYLARGMMEMPFWLLIIVFAALPGLCEEIAFRGFLQSGLMRSLGGWRTVIVVGLIFGLYHIDILRIPNTMILGIVLAIVCWKTGSIFPAMLIHIANNGLSTAAAWMKEKGTSTFLTDLYQMREGLPEAGDFGVSGRALIFIAIFIAGLTIILLTPQNNLKSSNVETSLT